MKQEGMFANKLTYQTVRWLYYHNRDGELLSCRSAEEVKALIWKYVSPTFTDEYDKQKFIKGAALINIDAIYDFVCDRRKYDVHPSYMSRYLLKCLQDERKREEKELQESRTRFQASQEVRKS